MDLKLRSLKALGTSELTVALRQAADQLSVRPTPRNVARLGRAAEALSRESAAVDSQASMIFTERLSRAAKVAAGRGTSVAEQASVDPVVRVLNRAITQRDTQVQAARKYARQRAADLPNPALRARMTVISALPERALGQERSVLRRQMENGVTVLWR